MPVDAVRHAALGGLVVLSLLAASQARAVEAPAVGKAATAAEQRQWLLQQVRVGEASGREALIEDALARLRLLAPDDRGTLLAMLEISLRRQRLDEARGQLQRLRQIGPGSLELRRAERLWTLYRADEQRQLQQAQLLATAGRREEALAIYDRLFAGDPPGLELGLQYWQLRGAQPGQRRLAIARLGELDRQYPGNAALRQALARMLFAENRSAEAIALLHRMSTDPASRDQAAQQEMDYLQTLPASPASVGHWRDFIARYPQYGQLDQARERYETQRRLVSDPLWRAGRSGLQLLERERNAEAEPLLRQGLRGYPRDAPLLGGLGLALLRQGRRQEAIGYFEQAQRNEQDDSMHGKWRDLLASARYWLLLEQAGQALTAAERTRARALYQQAHRQQPREVNAMLGLAEVAQGDGDEAEAERQLLAAQRLRPGDANVVRGLVRFYGRQSPQRLETYVATLPPSQRNEYAGLVNDARRAQLEQQAEQANAAGDGTRATALLQQAHALAPDDPWLSYRLANGLRAQGHGEQADAVFEQLVQNAGDEPQARYAQALYLSSSDRPEAALAALGRIDAARWNEDMRALAARIQRQQLLAEAWRLHGAGREDEAVALLRRQPQTDQIRVLLADWALQRQDYAQAQPLYGEVLASASADAATRADARLGQIETWIAQGDTDSALQALQDSPPVLADDAFNPQRRLANAWAAVGEAQHALDILRGLVARQTQPDALLYRDTARLLAQSEPQQALDAYALAMRDNGLLSAGQAAPRDDLALTRASRENAADDWLRRSLRRDVETLYQRRNPTLTLMQDSSRRSDGTPGISRLGRDTRIAHFDLPWAQGAAFARLEQIDLDAGRFATDADGVQREDFGTCRMQVVDAAQDAVTLPGCARDRHQRASGIGAAVGWRNADASFAFDIGRTPSGFEIANWVGAATWSGDLRWLDWSLTASRRPLTNSLLSQAGAVDPRTGIRWGSIVANGLTVGLGYDQGGRNGVWSSWGWHRLSGENVPDNDRVRAMAGWYHKLIQRTDLRLDAGVSAMYWRYARDLGGYSLGQGGYYSPQQYVSIGVPVSFAWRNQDWSLRLDASFSWSRARTDAARRFPETGLMAGVLEDLQPQYGPLALDPDDLYTGGGSSSGTGYRLHAALERRLSDHFVLGAAATLQRSRDYSPDSAQVYLRYTFEPWQGNLPLPVAPLIPYGEFR